MNLQLLKTCTMPVWTVCYLAYGDATEISDEEAQTLIEFEREMNALCSDGCVTYAFPKDIDADKEFRTTSYISSLGDDCIEIEVWGYPISV